MFEMHVTDISRAIQLAVAPVFLLTAIATVISALNLRLGRIIDRRRLLEDRGRTCTVETAPELNRELRMLYRRIRLIYFAILAAVLAALFVCLVVAGAFIGAMLAVDISQGIALMFIVAMGTIIVSLGLFLREVFLAVTGGSLRLRKLEPPPLTPMGGAAAGQAAPERASADGAGPA